MMILNVGVKNIFKYFKSRREKYLKISKKDLI